MLSKKLETMIMTKVTMMTMITMLITLMMMYLSKATAFTSLNELKFQLTHKSTSSHIILDPLTMCTKLR